MKSSFHSLIPFLPLFCNCHFRRLGSIQFLCSQAHILAGLRLETRLSTLCCSIELFFITTLHGLQGKHRLLLPLIVLGVFSAPLHSNGRGADHIDNILTTAEECLPRERVYRVVAQQWKHTSQYFSGMYCTKTLETVTRLTERFSVQYKSH
jgi:hypothetical protein